MVSHPAWAGALLSVAANGNANPNAAAAMTVLVFISGYLRAPAAGRVS
jgi:hypothetical protein